ncbi:MAG: hypothetical protein H6Q43_3922, partial [Deltaproteobacteria bacterium]|nr:hypothetical protein [Deltaproteobacteria bacterium]
PHSSVFARLASGAFYKTLLQLTLYEIIRILFRWEFLGFPWDGKIRFSGKKFNLFISFSAVMSRRKVKEPLDSKHIF